MTTIAKTRVGIGNIAPDITKEIAKNFLMGIETVRRWRLSRPRTSSVFTGTDEQLRRYAFINVEMLREWVGELGGKTVCEIGAGDYLTSGLAILAAGATRYAVIDRFPGNYTGATAKQWYAGIEKNWQRLCPDIAWNNDLRHADFPENYASRLELLAEPIETARTKQQYDIVCSFQVGEHISDINAFAEIHNRTMTLDGTALHRVDFGPHDCWHLYQDPLTFLHFPDWIWNLTGSNRGAPNRFRHHEFLAAFERANLETEVVKLEYFDETQINFEKLNPKFKKMPRESLLVGTAFYKLKRRG